MTVETETTVAAAAPATAPEATKPEAAPAPAAAPAAEPAKEGEYTYEPTGYANADYALSVIGKAGIGPDHPAVAAAYEGDFGQLEHLLASKNVPGANALLAMLKDAESQERAADAQAAEQIANEVYELAGSKEHWAEVQTWASANAEDSEKEVLNELFGSPKTHKIAATYLLSMYDRAQVPHEPRATVEGGRPAAAAPVSQPQGPLNRKEFAVEAGKLYQKLGNAYTTSPEYQQLARRLQG